MEAFVKTVLYAYPTLGELVDSYGVHIKNKAILSALDTTPASRIAEHLAKEIALKSRLEWLREKVERAISALSEGERLLLEERFFKRKMRKGLDGDKSERTYFRLQRKLVAKMQKLLIAQGVTKEVFEREFISEELFAKLYAFVKLGKNQRLKNI